MSFAFVDSALATLKSWAHTVAPVHSAAFEAVAWVSLGFYLVFAVVALHYTLKPWAEKAMLASMGGGAVASLVLHLSLLHSPSYVGEGALWKLVVLSQYLPWVVLSAGGLYVLYRALGRLRKERKASDAREA